MSRHLGFQGCYVSPEGFRDLRKSADLIRKQVADPVDFAIRTIQNWEMGGTRITWMAYVCCIILPAMLCLAKHRMAGQFMGTGCKPLLAQAYLPLVHPFPAQEGRLDSRRKAYGYCVAPYP